MSSRVYESILAKVAQEYVYDSHLTELVYDSLLHSLSRKRTQNQLGRITNLPVLSFLKFNTDKLEEFLLNRIHIETVPAEYHLLQKNDVTLKDFDTAYVFKEIQREITPREAIPLLDDYYSELSSRQIEEIENTFWENINEHIIDVARNIIASFQAKRKVLFTLPEVI